jgi:hypothetical protein
MSSLTSRSKSPSQNRKSKTEQASGEAWESKLFYFPVPSSCEEFSSSNLSSLKARIQDETIIRVWAQASPLHAIPQITYERLYHSYIIFQTEHYYWSIEKIANGIVLRRGLNIRAVRDFEGDQMRPWPNSSRAEDEGRYSIHEFIYWLKSLGELSRKYNLWSSNCQKFGRKVFNHLAKRKSYNEQGFIKSAVKSIVKIPFIWAPRLIEIATN